MKKLLALLLCIVLLLPIVACGSGGNGNTGAGSPPPTNASAGTPSEGTPAGFTGQIKVGVLPMNLTAQSGVSMMEGFNLAIDEVNAAGGVNGYEIVLVVEDTQSNRDVTINATTKLISQNEVVAVLGPLLSGDVLAIDGLVRASDIPFLIGGTHPSIPELKNPNFYGYRANDSLVATVAATFLADQTGVTKVGMITDSGDFGQGGKDIVSAYFDKIGMEYVSEVINNGDPDFSATIMKLRNAGCNGLFIWPTTEEFIVLSRQLYDLEFKVPTVTSPSLVGADTEKQCEPEWLSGIYAVTDYVNGTSDPVQADFEKKFLTAYGRLPENNPACSYSAATLFVDAMRRCADPTDRAQIREQLLLTKDLHVSIGYYNAKPDISQQFAWGVNVVMKNPDGSVSQLKYETQQ